DQGTVFANIALPPASSLERTEAVQSEVDSIFTTVDAVDARLSISGFGMLSGGGSQYGFVVASLKKWDEREKSVNEVIAELQRKTAHIKEADITFFSPPVVSGFGNTSGFTVNIQDLSSGELADLDAASEEL